MEQLEEQVSKMAISDFVESSKAKKAMMKPLSDTLEPPPLPSETSRELPCARKDVKLAYNEERGRHLVATEDIMPGTFLLKSVLFARLPLIRHV